MTKPRGIIILKGPGMTLEQAIEEHVGRLGDAEMLRVPASPADPETWYPDDPVRPEITVLESNVPRPRRGGPRPKRLGSRDQTEPGPEGKS
jgi:hypothetical protein